LTSIFSAWQKSLHIIACEFFTDFCYHIARYHQL
jgi:hypothetical protein